MGINRKTASSSDCINKAGVVRCPREIRIKSLVSFDGTCKDLLEWHHHDAFFLKNFRSLSWLKKGKWEAGAYRSRKDSRVCESIERISRHNFLAVYCVAYVYDSLKLLCVQSYRMQVAFGICVLMNATGVSLPVEWGKCCVLTFSFCYKP